MTSTLLIVQFVLAAFVVIAVLLQKSSSIGLGAYSGSNNSLFGAKGPGGFLTKVTMGLGLLFIINTLALGYFYNQQKLDSVVDGVKVESLIPSKADAPAAPVIPTLPSK
ncbi:MAG: preprotein translocase subunit SecG [Campylobacteraceae bacterium]|nr:preprotein translocase subunit SecG [Campylobacteraceae bacterium]